jgi:hypothetical protein
LALEPHSRRRSVRGSSGARHTQARGSGPLALRRGAGVGRHTRLPSTRTPPRARALRRRAPRGTHGTRRGAEPKGSPRVHRRTCTLAPSRGGAGRRSNRGTGPCSEHSESARGSTSRKFNADPSSDGLDPCEVPYPRYSTSKTPNPWAWRARATSTREAAVSRLLRLRLGGIEAKAQRGRVVRLADLAFREGPVDGTRVELGEACPHAADTATKTKRNTIRKGRTRRRELHGRSIPYARLRVRTQPLIFIGVLRCVASNSFRGTMCMKVGSACLRRMRSPGAKAVGREVWPW